jgi:hypothetical protein
MSDIFTNTFLLHVHLHVRLDLKIDFEGKDLIE